MTCKVTNNGFLALTFTKYYTISPIIWVGGFKIHLPPMDACFMDNTNPICTMFFLKCIPLMKFNL